MSVACADLTSGWVTNTSFPDVLYAQSGGFPVVATETKSASTTGSTITLTFRMEFDTPLPNAQYLWSASYGADDGALYTATYDCFQVVLDGDSAGSGVFWSWDASAVQDNYATGSSTQSSCSTGIAVIDYQCTYVDIKTTFAYNVGASIDERPTQAGWTLYLRKVGEAGPS